MNWQQRLAATCTDDELRSLSIMALSDDILSILAADNALSDSQADTIRRAWVAVRALERLERLAVGGHGPTFTQGAVILGQSHVERFTPGAGFVAAILAVGGPDAAP